MTEIEWYMYHITLKVDNYILSHVRVFFAECKL